MFTFEKSGRRAFAEIKFAVALGIICLSGTTFAQRASSDGLWQEVKESLLNVNAARPVIPKSYQSVRLDTDALLRILAQAPMEFTDAARTNPTVITLPLPDGSFARFQVQESPISLPDPSGKVSEFMSYSGQGMDDRTASVRLDISPAGFHAQILSAGETVYIDPYASNDTVNCISYYRRDLQRDGPRPACFASISDHFRGLGIPGVSSSLATPDGVTPSGANGAMLRSYRTAIAATGEYTTFFRQAGDTDDQAKARALTAIKTTMNRVNGIWGRDTAIRYVLLAPLHQLVSDVLTSQFVSLKADGAKKAAIDVFRKYDRSALPVTDSKGSLVGIVTDRKSVV